MTGFTEADRERVEKVIRFNGIRPSSMPPIIRRLLASHDSLQAEVRRREALTEWGLQAMERKVEYVERKRDSLQAAIRSFLAEADQTGFDPAECYAGLRAALLPEGTEGEE